MAISPALLCVGHAKPPLSGGRINYSALTPSWQLGEVQSTLPSATTSEEAGLAPLLMTLGPALAAAAGSGGGRGRRRASRCHLITSC